MASTLKLLTESELAVFEDIIECPRCLSGENICDSHAEAIKKVLIKTAKNDIEKLSAESN